MRFWLSNNDGNASGPFELRDIRAMAARGELSPEAQVCIEGGSAWTPVWSVIAEAGAPPTHPEPPAAPAMAFSGYAGFGKRFAALVIDTIVMMIVGFIVAFMIGLAMVAGGTDDPEALEAMGNVVGILLNWIYFATMESSPLQATLGKLALGIKVTDLEGRRVGLGRATGRYFAKFISALILLIGFIMAAFTEKKQGLHDMIAGCLVVNR